MRRTPHVTILAAAIVTVACAPGGSLAVSRVVEVATGPYGALAWVGDDRIVVSRFSRDTPSPATALVTFSMPDGAVRPLPLPQWAEPCTLRDIRTVTELGEGRVGYLELCLNDGTPEVGSFARLMELDLATGKAVAVASTGDRIPTDVTWAPALRRGFFEAHSGISAVFQPFDANGPRTDPLPFADGEHAWDVAGDTAADGADGCRGAGRAASPQLSPDGEVAFLASPTSLPFSGTSRLDEPWYVYASGAGPFAPRRISPPIEHAGSMRWSRDKTVAVSGEVKGTKGLWLLTRDDGKPGFRLLVAGEVASFSWSPDGRRLAVLRRGEGDPQLLLVEPPAAG